MDMDVLFKLSYGVYIVSAMDGDKPTGCVANSAMQVTDSPTTVAVSVNHNNYTHELIEKTKRFSLSILQQEHEPKIIGQFGFRCGKDYPKFDNIDYEIIDGQPAIKSSIGTLIFDVVNTMESDTHTVFLGKLTNAIKFHDEDPMTYAYYHKVLKGKTAKNAPTYNAFSGK